MDRGQTEITIKEFIDKIILKQRTTEAPDQGSSQSETSEVSPFLQLKLEVILQNVNLFRLKSMTSARTLTENS